LDNEVSESGAGNLIIVGGPCANTVFQDLVNAGKIPSTFTCRDASGVLGSSWTPGVSYIITVPDAFKTGQTAVLFAGYEAAETRVSTSIGQLFSTKLNSINEYSVKITGTDPSTATITII
jgi:S-layer protein (TIGR01564 family)